MAVFKYGTVKKNISKNASLQCALLGYFFRPVIYEYNTYGNMSVVIQTKVIDLFSEVNTHSDRKKCT